MSDTIVDVDRMRAATRKELKMRKKRLLCVLKRLNKHTYFFSFFHVFSFFPPSLILFSATFQPGSQNQFHSPLPVN